MRSANGAAVSLAAAQPRGRTSPRTSPAGTGMQDQANDRLVDPSSRKQRSKQSRHIALMRTHPCGAIVCIHLRMIQSMVAFCISSLLSLVSQTRVLRLSFRGHGRLASLVGLAGFASHQQSAAHQVEDVLLLGGWMLISSIAVVGMASFCKLRSAVPMGSIDTDEKAA